MGVVKLCIDIRHHVLIAFLTDIPAVLVVQLCPEHQPEIGSKQRGIDFAKGVGIFIAQLDRVVGVSGIDVTCLGKEDGFVLEDVRV